MNAITLNFETVPCLVAESAKLEQAIKANLRELGYAD